MNEYCIFSVGGKWAFIIWKIFIEISGLAMFFSSFIWYRNNRVWTWL